MEELDKVLFNLKVERNSLSNKMSALAKFRGTDDWNKLSVNHKCLLDIQLEAMRTYSECLSARIVDLEETIDEQKEPVEEENNIEDVVKIIVIKKD